MRRKIISIIVLLSIFIVVFQTTVLAVNPADLKPAQEDVSQIRISNLNTLIRMIASLFEIIISPILLIIGIIIKMKYKNKDESKKNKGILIIWCAVILFIISSVIQVSLQPVFNVF